jgi:DNA polymerase-3 subunit gamma/tau
VFENLIGQEAVAGQLRRDIGAGELPSSILLSGPAASGKFTAALEIGRILSCQFREPEPAAWNCSCPACNRHRSLSHPDLLILGPRSFPEEIEAAFSLLERAPGRASAYFFIRAVRKLQKRFDAVLFEGEETRLAKAAPLVRDIEEKLDLIRPEEPIGEGASEAARAIADTAEKLEALVPDTTPVFQVRALGYWARLAPLGRMKTIIIENADLMLDASRNALLKILEEPPASVEFVLLSSRRSALLATIQSRVRPYIFVARRPEDEAEVLERVFKASPDAAARAQAARSGSRRPGAIEAFLAEERAFPPAEARRLAASFMGAVAARRALRGELDAAIAGMECLGEDLRFAATPEAARELGALALADLAQATKDFGAKDEAYASSFPDFLAALSALLGEMLRLPGLGTGGLILIDGWAALIRDARSQFTGLNRSPGLLSESLLYAMGSP